MSQITFTNYTKRFLARIVLEAKTPLAIGSGKEDVYSDALVVTDVNGLPYIPGTALAGVLRSMIGEEQAKIFFGCKGEKKDSGKGSEIIFSEGKIINSEGKVVDGLRLDAFNDSLLSNYKALPIRQHVRIDGKGVNEDHGKFDEQVVFTGTRFCFEIEMVADKEATLDNFNSVLKCIKNNTFRIGSGSRSGFGAVEVVEIKKMVLDLKEPTDLQTYLNKSSKLSEDCALWQTDSKEEIEDNNWTRYKITLTPNDFFLFSSGFGDEEVDSTPVVARKVEWEKNGKGQLSDHKTLIPASSVKGALAHRVAFHYNKIMKRFAESTGDNAPKVGEGNEAVRSLFGYSDDKVQKRGNLLFSDIIEKEEYKPNIMNHVSIDRFTGGAREGALFNEKATYAKGKVIEMTVLVNKCVTDENVIKAWENALEDLCKSMLPLGGAVNKGYGMFTGKWNKQN